MMPQRTGLNQDFVLIDKKKTLIEALSRSEATYMTWVKEECLYQENVIKLVVA